MINTHAEFYVQQVHYHVDNLLSNLLLTIVPAIIKVFHSFFCIFFIAKFDIDIANKMVSKVITHIHFFNFTILKQQQQAKLTFEAYKGLISMPLNFWQGGGNVVLRDSKYCTLLAFWGTSLNYCLNNFAIHSLVLVTGLLIFHAVADPRNSGISAKSREIPQKTRNTAKSAKNISKYMSAKHI